MRDETSKRDACDEVDTLGRRDFLLFALKGATPPILNGLLRPFFASFAGALGATIGGEAVVDEYRRTRDELAERAKVEMDEIEIGRRLLFGDAFNKFGVPSTDNPFAPIKGITKPTGDATRSIISRLALLDGELEFKDNLAGSPIDGSVLLLGGPVANGFSQHILGRGGTSPLLILGNSDRRSVFPIRFDIETPRRQGDYLPYSQGSGHRPKWQLVVEHKGIIHRQQVNIRNGHQQNDFLILTSIPNVYSTNISDRIVIVSGAHGSGTRAIDLLLGDINSLACLSKCVGAAEAWQALIFINKIDVNTAWPLEISVDENFIFRIDAEFDALRERLKGHPLGFQLDPVVVGHVRAK